jgi:hypothetical protein
MEQDPIATAADDRELAEATLRVEELRSQISYHNYRSCASCAR